MTTLVAVLLGVTGCSRFYLFDADPVPTALPAETGGATHGTLLEARPIERLDPLLRLLGATGVTLRYRSTSAVDGSATDVTGVGFVPGGRPPPAGWPVIAFGHAAIGIDVPCAPSLRPELGGSLALVAGLLQLGFAVAATDYQGLGAPNPTPFLDNRTAAWNMIDAVIALRAVSPTISTRWAAMGVSQGGGASWAAGEQSADYGEGLDYVGGVSIAPFADMAGLVDRAVDGTLTSEQLGLYVWALMGLERTRPGFPVDDYRRGLATEQWSALSSCLMPGARQRAEILTRMPPDDVRPASPEAAQRLRQLLADMAVPDDRATEPLLVIYGGVDPSVPPEWTGDAVARACGLGSPIATVFQPDRGGEDLDIDDYIAWLISRFAGDPAPSDC